MHLLCRFFLMMLFICVDSFISYSFANKRKSAVGTMKMQRAIQEELMLGVLPFGINECLLPGQARYLHLYEARFLALFEDSIERNDKIALAYVTDTGHMISLGVIAKIEKWQQLDVGVGATIRAVERMQFLDIDRENEERPFLLAKLKTFSSAAVEKTAPSTSNDTELVAVLEDLLYELDELATRHSIDLSARRDPAIDPRAMLLDYDELKQMNEKQQQEKKNLAQRAKVSANELDQSYADILSYLALEAADPESKIYALTANTNHRLSAAIKQIRKERDELAAKAAIKALNLDSSSLGEK